MGGFTPSQTPGPFVTLVVTREPVDADTFDDGVRIRGRVLDGAGEPVPDVLLEVWQADTAGSYEAGLFHRVITDGDGAWELVTVKPGCVATGDALQAPHLAVTILAGGLLRHLMTRLYFPEEAANEADPVLRSIADTARRATLVALPDGDDLRFDIRLSGEGETVFFDV